MIRSGPSGALYRSVDSKAFSIVWIVSSADSTLPIDSCSSSAAMLDCCAVDAKDSLYSSIFSVTDLEVCNSLTVSSTVEPKFSLVVTLSSSTSSPRIVGCCSSTSVVLFLCEPPKENRSDS